MDLVINEESSNMNLFDRLQNLSQCVEPLSENLLLLFETV